MFLIVHKPRDVVTARETLHELVLVFVDTTMQIVRHTRVKSSGLIAHYVHIALFHPRTYGHPESRFSGTKDLFASAPSHSSLHHVFQILRSAQNDIFADERREGEKERNSPSLCTHPCSVRFVIGRYPCGRT